MNSTETEWTTAEIESLMLLPESTQEQILESLTQSERMSLASALSRRSLTDRDKDILSKRADRAEAARIFIPACVNPQRRERALLDPELFLRGTYLSSRYKRPFGKLHYAIMDALIEVANNGGKQAIAAPRGRGKTEIVKGMLLYLIFAGLVQFPIPIGQTRTHAEKIYKDFRKKIAQNDLLLEDFPEVCWPVRCLEGAPQRAAKQHIDGKLTGVIWTNEALKLASVPPEHRGPIDYSLVNLEFRGLDTAIRGVNTDGARPDFIIIDDPETRESAKSDNQIEDRKNAIEQDIAGLAGEDEELAQVMLTTVQNRKCISFQYTDPEQKPSWMGKRFGWVEKWPHEWSKEGGLWHTYMSMRAQDQRNGDRYGRTATQFFLDNQDAMIAGGELLADNYKAKVLSDGWRTVHSAWQVVFNAIADTSYDAFCTEYQNDPPEAEQIQTMDLTYQHILGCNSEHARGIVPDWATIVTRGTDMGKVNCWYVDVAWSVDGTSAIIDYGRFQTFGLTTKSSEESIELAMLNALESFAKSHEGYEINITFADSGYKPEAVYEACRRVEGNYYPVKGPDSNSARFSMPQKSSKTCMPYFECYASETVDKQGRPLWLFHPNTEFWKNWAQERLILSPWTDGDRTLSSMAVFSPPHGDTKFHTQFAKSMVSERLVHIPLPGKGFKTVWEVLDRHNNHWLDCVGYAAAAAAVLGVRLVPTYTPPVVERQQPKREAFNPYARHGRAFVATQR